MLLRPLLDQAELPAPLPRPQSRDSRWVGFPPKPHARAERVKGLPANRDHGRGHERSESV
jgi:hypothetical protein